MTDSEHPRTLDQIRYAAGLTQHQLARASGVAWSTIAKLELGEHRPLNSTVDKLAAVLGDEVYRARYGWRKVYRKRGRPRTWGDQAHVETMPEKPQR